MKTATAKPSLPPSDTEAPGPRVDDFIRIFDGLFRTAEGTILRRGTGDPLYIPGGSTREGASLAEIRFAHGFYESALHEVSHWCIAGPRRRTLPDYGYWYEPDGRTPERQRQFEAFEARNQGLEWLLTEACGLRFHVSADNLGGGGGSGASFARLVRDSALKYWQEGLPPRAARLQDALFDFYRTRDRCVAFWQDVARVGRLPEH